MARTVDHSKKASSKTPPASPAHATPTPAGKGKAPAKTALSKQTLRTSPRKTNAVVEKESAVTDLPERNAKFKAAAASARLVKKTSATGKQKKRPSASERRAEVAETARKKRKASEANERVANDAQETGNVATGPRPDTSAAETVANDASGAEDDSSDDGDLNSFDRVDVQHNQPRKQPKNKPKHVRDRDRLERNGFKKWIGAQARAAVFDAAPHVGEGSPKRLHLYWANEPAESCAINLIKRTPELKREASAYADIEAYAETIACDVTFHSRKARNKHVYQVREMFFRDTSVYQIAEHVLADTSFDDNGDSATMAILPRFKPTLNTVQDCIDLLMSDEMHADQTSYANFVSALQSGKLSKVRKQPDKTPLAAFISVNYEAHYRLELWYALNKQGFRHDNANGPAKIRTDNFTRMRKLVHNDRRKNDEQAELDRAGRSQTAAQEKEARDLLAQESGELASDDDAESDE